MTTLTTSAPDVAATAIRRSGAGFLTAALQAAQRTILQFVRTPQIVMMVTIQGALFLFLFRYIFGGAIDIGRSVEYVDFLVPGFLATTFLWNGTFSTAGVAEDSASGAYDRLRSLPIPRAAVMVGRSLADLTLFAWALLVTAILGFAVGFRTHADLPSVVLAFALILVAAYAVSWMFINFGLASGGAQAAQGMATVVIVPLVFVSSAYVPADSLPGWMQPVANHQPVTVFINAVRSLMLGGTDAVGIGHSTAYWVALSLGWCAATLAVFGTLAVSRFARVR